MTTPSSLTIWDVPDRGTTSPAQIIYDGKIVEEESKTNWSANTKLNRIGALALLLLLTAGITASLVLSSKSLAEVEQEKASLMELQATVAQLGAVVSSLAGSITGLNSTQLVASFLCIGEIVSQEQIDWNLDPRGYSHTSWLPTVRSSPRPACTSVMPTWAGGSSKDDPNNYFLINTSGRYLVRAWGSWDGMTGTVIDHNGGVTCYKPSGGEQRASLWYELANRKITRFQGTTMMDLVAGDKCFFNMYVWWDPTFPGSEQVSNGVEFELRNVAIN